MHFIKSLIIFCLVLMCWTTAAALDLQQGVHGMYWTGSGSESSHLTKVREDGPVTYYVDANAAYQVANRSVPALIYGFYKDQFFASYIKLGLPLQFHNLKRHFTATYGEPKVHRQSENRSTILRWKDGEVKIKLKMKESGVDIKLAIYYAPLASELNQVRSEQVASDLIGTPPSKSTEKAKPAPLFND